MKYSKPLERWAQYSVDNLGRICPVYNFGCIMQPWKDFATFDQAIAEIAESSVFQNDTFPPDGAIQPVEISELRTKRYLDIEEGFFLATGVTVSGSVFRFEWANEVFFNIRPDFGFHYLCSDGDMPLLNAAEAKISSLMIDYYLEADALQRAIQFGEIDPQKLYSFEHWKEFWTSRDIATQDTCEAKKIEDKALKTTERDTLLIIIAALCNEGKIKLDEKGAAGFIVKLTQDLGAPVSENTIRTALNKIPEALERRAK